MLPVDRLDSYIQTAHFSLVHLRMVALVGPQTNSSEMLSDLNQVK